MRAGPGADGGAGVGPGAGGGEGHAEPGADGEGLDGNSCSGAGEHHYPRGEGCHQEEKCEDRMGTAKRYYEGRGYGFIAPDLGGRDLFVHRQDVAEEGSWKLRRGQRVNYREEQGPKGMEATAVRIGARGPEREGDGQEQRDGQGPSGQRADFTAEAIKERIRVAAFAVSCRGYGRTGRAQCDEEREMRDELAEAIQAGFDARMERQAVQEVLAKEGLQMRRGTRARSVPSTLRRGAGYLESCMAPAPLKPQDASWWQSGARGAPRPAPAKSHPPSTIHLRPC